MIAEIFPQGLQRYATLPVLGPLMDGYVDWLRRQQYTWRSTRYELRMAAQVAEYLKRRGVRRIDELAQRHLDACHHRFRRRFPEEAGSVLVLARFLPECGPLANDVGSAIQDYLKKVPRYGVHRQVLLRIKAPGGALKPTAVRSKEEVDSCAFIQGSSIARSAIKGR
jgi:hypothetical protein